MSKSLSIHLWECEFFSIHSPLAEGYVTLIPEKALEVEEGDQVEIKLGAESRFDGDVCSVWMNDVGTQVISLVPTSVSSSTGDPEMRRVGTAVWMIRKILGVFAEYSQREIKKQINDLDAIVRD